MAEKRSRGSPPSRKRRKRSRPTIKLIWSTNSIMRIPNQASKSLPSTNSRDLRKRWKASTICKSNASRVNDHLQKSSNSIIVYYMMDNLKGCCSEIYGMVKTLCSRQQAPVDIYRPVKSEMPVHEIVNMQERTAMVAQASENAAGIVEHAEQHEYEKCDANGEIIEKRGVKFRVKGSSQAVNSVIAFMNPQSH